MVTASSNHPVAVITGGSRGIGRAVAHLLAREGWDIAFTYLRNEAAAKQTRTELQALGRRALALRADVASREDAARVFETVAREFGRVDNLINNAAILGEPRSILDVDDAHLTQVFRTNVLGSFFCAGEAARRMSTQRGGSGGTIVNLSSLAARYGGTPGEAHYAASKGAIDSFTRAMAKELAPHGIRVNAVRGGWINTDIHDAHGGRELVQRAAQLVPLGRAGTPEEVAQVIAFLAGPLSSFMSGALVDVSGGR